MAREKSEDPEVRDAVNADDGAAAASGEPSPAVDPDLAAEEREAAAERDAAAAEERDAAAAAAEREAAAAEERAALATEVEAHEATVRADAAASVSHPDDEVEEEHGRSFAARALTLLLTLLVGAGLGIWAAPRIAPLLPSGLAPVAAWLTPGRTELDARVAAVETRLEGDLGALGARIDALPDGSALQAEARGLVETAQTDLSARIDALRTELASTATGDMGERIGALETALEGATTELAALKSQIESGAAGLSAEATQNVDTYRAELEGLRAEVGRLSGSVSGLGSRLQEAMSAADARVSAAQEEAAQVQQTAAAQLDLSAARTDVAQIRAALASGAPFQEPLDRLAQDAGVAVPEGLTAAAATGVATPAQLRAQFSDAAHTAIRASIQAGAGEGIINRSRAFLGAQVASRSLTPREGLDPDAVLSRVEDALRRDDIEAAIAEADALTSEARTAMDGWIAAAKRRADAEAGLAELTASASGLN